MNTPTPIQDSIANDLGIAHLSKEDQQEIIVTLGEAIYKRTMLEVLKALPDEHVDEFEKLVDADDQEKLASFLEEKIPGYKEMNKKVATEEIQKFKNGMAELAALKKQGETTTPLQTPPKETA